MLSLWSDWDGFGRSAFTRDFYRTLRALEELRTDMDRAFGWPDHGLTRFAEFGPEISLSDDGNSLTLRAELPGMSEKEVDVSVDAHTLTLRGERKVETPKGYSVHRQERQSFRFERSYQLPSKVDASKGNAVMKNGVLTLTLPKAPEAQPKQISVKAG